MRCLHRRKGRVIHSLLRATITAEHWRKQYNHILYPQKYFFIEWEKKSHEDWLSHVCLLLVQADTPAAPCQHTWCKLSEFHKVPISSSFYSSDALFYEPHRWSACHFRRSKSLLFTASMWHCHALLMAAVCGTTWKHEPLTPVLFLTCSVVWGKSLQSSVPQVPRMWNGAVIPL